jgi:hypothetical protein
MAIGGFQSRCAAPPAHRQSDQRALERPGRASRLPTWPWRGRVGCPSLRDIGAHPIGEPRVPCGLDGGRRMSGHVVELRGCLDYGEDYQIGPPGSAEFTFSRRAQPLSDKVEETTFLRRRADRGMIRSACRATGPIVARSVARGLATDRQNLPVTGSRAHASGRNRRGPCRSIAARRFAEKICALQP